MKNGAKSHEIYFLSYSMVLCTIVVHLNFSDSEKSKPFFQGGSLLGALVAYPFIHLFIYSDASICHDTELAEN